MRPIGPYKNKWAGHSPLFLIKDDQGVIRTVFDGQPVKDGIMHPTMRDAKSYLQDNGFELDSDTFSDENAWRYSK